jgi:hypothetical protein
MFGNEAGQITWKCKTISDGITRGSLCNICQYLIVDQHVKELNIFLYQSSG